MSMQQVKSRLERHAEWMLFYLLAAQPLLDVLSYFMQKADMTVITTALRAILLFAVTACGFLLSEKRNYYYLMFTAVILFWLLHMLANAKGGYISLVGDFAEYLKLIQIPLWTLAFISFFEACGDMTERIFFALFCGFVTILLVIALSHLTGHPAYTYDYPDRNIQIGLLGWFDIANSQSAIVSILVPAVVLYAFLRDHIPLYYVTCILGFGLLFFTGTRLAFYSGILTAAVFLACIVLKREPYFYALPMLLVIILFLAFRGASPMAERRQMATDTHAMYQAQTDEIMEEDRGFVYKRGTEIPPETLARIKQVYLEVYGKEGQYGNAMLTDLIDRFGVDRVMKTYGYTLDADVLYDGRTRRINTCKLIMNDLGIGNRLFGFEYQETYINGNIYDPENDFTALIFYYGFLGAGAFAAFLIYFLVRAAKIFFTRFPENVNMEFITWLLMLGLGLVAAQFSGQVLRKPSVGVYLALACAGVHYYCNTAQFGVHSRRRVRLAIKRY